VREQVAKLSAWLGVKIDAGSERVRRVTHRRAVSRVAVAIVPTNEEGMIARYTAEVLAL